MSDIRPIDANALAEEFRHESLDAGFYRAIYEGAARRAEAAPTLDYAPVKHGEWVLRAVTPRTTIIDEAVTCRLCGSSFHRITGTWFKHCPECGAKMDGGKKDG